MPSPRANEPDEPGPDGRFRRVRPLDARIADALDQRDRVIARAELLALGLSETAIYKRVARGGMHRKQRGVYTAGSAMVPAAGEWRAVLDAVGVDAWLDGLTACAAWGLREPADGELIHVVCLRDVRDRPGARVHWQADLPLHHTTLRAGIRTVMVDRALLGVAASAIEDRRLRRLVNQGLLDRRVSLPQLADLVVRSKGRRGAGKLARVLATARPTRSDLEDMAAAVLVAHGCTEFETNVRVAAGEADIYFRAARLVVECDSRYHDTALARADDAAKDARYQASGLHVVRLRLPHLTSDVHRCIPRLLELERTRREMFS